MVAAMRLRKSIVVCSVVLGMVGAVAATNPAGASASPTSLKGWMLAQGSAEAFAKSAGAPVPVQWVSCADYPTGNPSGCGKKIKIGGKYFPDLIRETAYYALRNELEHKPKPLIAPGSGVLADYETWDQTPASQQKHPEEYICKTDQLAAKYHLFLVQSPFNPSIGVRVKEEVAAASCAKKYGANEVTELQYQGRELNAKAYKEYIGAAVMAIHAAVRNARIMGGLAIDLDKKPVRFCDIVHSYFATKSRLSGYWLNGSNPSSLGVQFFEYIGAMPKTMKLPSCKAS
jgi:hypothetical protein